MSKKEIAHGFVNLGKELVSAIIDGGISTITNLGASSAHLAISVASEYLSKNGKQARCDGTGYEVAIGIASRTYGKPNAIKNLWSSLLTACLDPDYKNIVTADDLELLDSITNPAEAFCMMYIAKFGTNGPYQVDIRPDEVISKGALLLGVKDSDIQLDAKDIHRALTERSIEGALSWSCAKLPLFTFHGGFLGGTYHEYSAGIARNSNDETKRYKTSRLPLSCDGGFEFNIIKMGLTYRAIKLVEKIEAGAELIKNAD